MDCFYQQYTLNFCCQYIFVLMLKKYILVCKKVNHAV